MRRWRILLPLALPVLAGCGQDAAPAWSGYAEGDYVYVAAPLPGTLVALQVQAGQKVAQGTPLFTLDAQAERAAREEAQARVAAAGFQARNLDKGRRAPEIAIQEAQLAQARAQLTLAERELARKASIVETGAIARTEYDASRTAAEQARAQVRELEAALQVARLPSRNDERAAADAEAEAARQVLRQAEWREQQTRRAAPAEGVVSDTFFRAGEFVPAGQAVLALLPPGHLKLRFYVAEAELARLAPGQEVKVSCDGCGEPIAARVSFIATQPEFTPPVIYSNAQRSKLVFLVEARPVAVADAARLRPGQPVDVRAAGPR